MRNILLEIFADSRIFDVYLIIHFEKKNMISIDIIMDNLMILIKYWKISFLFSSIEKNPLNSRMHSMKNKL